MDKGGCPNCFLNYYCYFVCDCVYVSVCMHICECVCVLAHVEIRWGHWVSSSIALHHEARFLTKTAAHSFDLVCWSVHSGDSPVSDHNACITGTCDYAWLSCMFSCFVSSSLIHCNTELWYYVMLEIEPRASCTLGKHSELSYIPSLHMTLRWHFIYLRTMWVAKDLKEVSQGIFLSSGLLSVNENRVRIFQNKWMSR